MATSNNRDVRLTVQAQTQGEESIRKLAAQVRALGKEGADAAPEFQRLANELDSLAGQTGAVESFKRLSAEVEAAGAAMRNAATIAEGTQAQYDQQAQATERLREAQKRAADEVRRVRGDLDDQREALRRYRITASEAERESETFAASVRKQRLAILDLGTELRARREDLAKASAATREASAAEDKLASSRDRAAKVLQTNVAAEKQAAEALQDAADAAAKAGVNVADLATEETRLATTLNSVADAAEKNRVQMLEAADAAKQLAEQTMVVERAQRALDGIRKAAYQQDQAAKIRAEAEATAALAREQAQAERIQTALANIRKTAFQQDQAARLKDEAAAQKQLNAEQAQAERIQTALNNIRRIAYQTDAAAKIKAEAEAMEQLAAAAKRAADALPNAFGAAGVRSVAAIQGEISQTARAVEFLEQQFKAGAISAYDLQRATGAAAARMQQLRQEIETLPAATGALERMNEAVLGLVNRFGALSAAVATVGFAVKPVLDANLALESMRRILTTVYGSAEEAGRQIDFVRSVAEAAGLDVAAAGQSFAKFAASAKASGLDTSLVQQVFEATAQAAGNLGLSTDKTTHILDALAQMANKGTVSMEELRQQLGDSLPGALSLLASGLGISESQLVKLVESGKLLTSEALGPLAEAMTALASPSGRVEGLRAAMSRLGNQFTLAYQQISDTSFYRALTSVVGGLADNFNAVTTAVKLMVEALVVSKVATAISNFIGLRQATTSVAAATVEATAATAAHTAATGANTAATVANTTAKTANAVASGVMGTAAVAATGVIATVGTAAATAAASVSTLERAKSTLGAAAGRLTTALGGPVGALATFGLAIYELGPALVRGAASLVGYGDRTDEVTKKLKAAEVAVREGAAAREAEAGGLVRAKVLYAEQAAVLANATSNAERMAKATRDQGEASVLAAEMTGNERLKLQAVTEARTADAAALEQVAVAKRAEATLTEGLIAQTEKSLEGRGRLNEVDQRRLETLLATRESLGALSKAQADELAGLLSRKDAAEKAVASTRDQIKADKDRLETQRAASAEAEAAAERERALAEQARFNAEASRDLTGRIRELEQQYRTARDSVDLMRFALERGETTQAEYNRTVREAGYAQGLYRVALQQAAAAGVDFREIQTGVSDEFFKTVGRVNGVITSLKEMGASAEAVSPQLSAALDKALTTATTRREVEFLVAEIRRARDAGLLLGADYEDAMRRARIAIESLAPAMQQAQRDAATLGVTLKDKIGGGVDQGVNDGLRAYERLKAGGQATEREIGQAFVSLATKAIEANRGIVPEWVKVEAAARGATIQIDEAGRATVRAADLSLRNAQQIAAGFKTVENSVDRATAAMQKFAAQAQANTDKSRGWTYGADGFVEQNGSRFTAGGQLTPPDSSGDWEFVGDVRTNNVNAPAGAVPVNGQGYWKRRGGPGGGSQPAALGAAGAAPAGGSAPGVAALSTGTLQRDLVANQNAGTTGLSAQEANRLAAENARAAATNVAGADASTGVRTLRLDLGGGRSIDYPAGSAAEAARVEALLQRLQQESARAGG